MLTRCSSERSLAPEREWSRYAGSVWDWGDPLWNLEVIPIWEYYVQHVVNPLPQTESIKYPPLV